MKKIVVMSGLIVGLISNAFAFDVGGMISKAIVDKQLNDERPVKSIAKSLVQGVLEKKQKRENSWENQYIIQMENAPEWKELVKIIYDSTQLMNQNLENGGLDFNNCKYKKESFADGENKFFMLVNEKLPKVHGSLTEFLNVNTFSQLNKFNINKNLTVSYMPYQAAVAYSMKKRNDNVSKNLTAIALDQQLTMALDQIYKDSKRNYKTDNQDIYNAAIYDMATLGYLIRTNQYQIKIEDYIDSMLTMYARDKIMCVFD